MVKKRPCLFLDRDGVLIEDVGYPYREDQIRIMPGAFELIRWARGKGYHVVVISNQAGIAKGLFGVSEYDSFTKILSERFAAAGATVDAWYYCPYHPEAKVAQYKMDSECRKPRPGMYHQALKDLPIDADRSIMVGDKDSDVLDGVKMDTFLIKGRYPLTAPRPVFENLKQLLAHFEEVYG